MNASKSLPRLLLEPLERILNAAFAADPVAQRGLSELDGRQFLVEIEDLRLIVSITIQARELHLAGSLENPQATVRGHLGNLAAAARSGNPRGLDVSGDAELVQGLAHLMARVPRAAWESISQRLGDGPAHVLERTAGTLFALLKDTRQRLGTQAGEYLQYETRLLPSREEIETFFTEVEKLRDDVERLGKRIERLDRGG